MSFVSRAGCPELLGSRPAAQRPRSPAAGEGGDEIHANPHARRRVQRVVSRHLPHGFQNKEQTKIAVPIQYIVR